VCRDPTGGPSRSINDDRGIGDDAMAMATVNATRAFIAPGVIAVVAGCGWWHRFRCCGCGRQLDVLHCETQLLAIRQQVYVLDIPTRSWFEDNALKPHGIRGKVLNVDFKEDL
jgi:hypothetical protein